MASILSRNDSRAHKKSVVGKVAELKVPFGLREGQLVHISSVERGDRCGCVCIACGQPLVARKGNLKVHHFAHNSASKSCSRESVLHLLGKSLLRARIEKALSKNVALPIQWECEVCKLDHRENLVKKARTVVEEFNLGTARSDLILLNQHRRPYIACEIVVSHRPEESVKAFYKSREITCVEFHVSDEKQLEMLASGCPIFASKVDYCPTPLCECGEKLFPRSIYVVESGCKICRKPMKASYGYFGYGPLEPLWFKSEEVIYARDQGVKIERRYSGAARRWCFMNLCPHCDSPWDDGTLWDRFSTDPSYDVLWHCEKCDKTRPIEESERRFGDNVLP